MTSGSEISNVNDANEYMKEFLFIYVCIYLLLLLLLLLNLVKTDYILD